MDLVLGVEISLIFSGLSKMLSYLRFFFQSGTFSIFIGMILQEKCEIAHELYTPYYLMMYSNHFK